MSIYQRYHYKYEKYFYRPIACCNIRSFYIVRYEADKDAARKEVVDEDEVEVVTIEEYEKETGEKFDPEEDFQAQYDVKEDVRKMQDVFVNGKDYGEDIEVLEDWHDRK